MTALPQERRVVTAIPGPKSQELQARRRRGRGGCGLRPARLHRARRRRHHRGRRRQPPDRLRFRHRRDLGRRLRRGRRTQGVRAARRLHPHLFHGHALRGVRGGLRGAGRADAGRPRQEVGAVQLRRRGRRERRQDRPCVHQAPGGRRLRPRLPRPDQPDDGADREEHAVQARLRSLRARGLPRPGGVRLPLADRSRERRPRGRRPGHRPDQQAGRRGERGRDHHRAGARRGRLHRAGQGLPAGRQQVRARTTASSSSRTRSSPASAVPASGSPARTRASYPT